MKRERSVTVIPVRTRNENSREMCRKFVAIQLLLFLEREGRGRGGKNLVCPVCDSLCVNAAAVMHMF